MSVQFKERKFKISIDDPEEAQQFLNGLILAKQNNSSPYFPMLIDAVNSILEPYNRALAEQFASGIAPNAKVSVD